MYVLPSPAMGKVFRGPNQFPFLALLPAEEWANLIMDEVSLSLSLSLPLSPSHLSLSLLPHS